MDNVNNKNSNKNQEISSVLVEKNNYQIKDEIKRFGETYFNYVFATNKKERLESAEQLPQSVLWTTKFTGCGFLAGLFSGAYLQASTRSHQFLAENAHRLPSMKVGWYYYHKYKNNEMILAGIRGGIKYGMQFAWITGSFAALECLIEEYSGIGREGVVSGAGAGLGSALVFSLFSKLGHYRYDRQYLRHAIRFGLYGGLLIGLTEEFYVLLSGESIKYYGLQYRKWSDYSWGESVKDKVEKWFYSEETS